MRVSPAGGKPQTLVGMTMSERVPYSPQLLPDGDTVLFTIAKTMSPGRLGEAQIVAQSLKTGERKTLIEGGTMRGTCRPATSCMRSAGLCSRCRSIPRSSK